jgi:AraC family transcriptional regulator
MKVMSYPARQEYAHPTATPATDLFTQVSPSDAVTRRSASWPGMSVEIIQDNRRGRIDYHCCAPVHMLVVHERGVRHDGCTVIDGISKSTLRDCGRKLAFVPAGHTYHDWHEPRTLSRVVFFYFDPAQLGMEPEMGSSCRSFAPRLFFEDCTLMETALKLATFIESDGPDDQHYAEALGVILVHELARISAGSPPAEA